MTQITEIENKKLEDKPIDDQLVSVKSSTKPKTKFQQECEEAYTLEEARQILYKRIEDRWKK